MRLLAEVTFGTGALAVIGGTVGVIAFLSFFTGTEVGLQGYAALDQLGTSAFTGFISAYFNTREIAPLVAGLALSATVGCGFTAQLGAMRITEEIDALEVMGVPSLPFLVTTRIIAGFVAVIPLYVLGLLSSLLRDRGSSPRRPTGSPTGTYDHYFNLFLPPQDVLWSFLKVLVFAVVIILTHCYYGYRASGGPAGVGVAVGRAVRFVDRRGQHHRLVPVAGHLGRHHDRADRGVSRAMTHERGLRRPAPAAGPGVPRRPGAAARAVGRHVPEGVHRRRDGDAEDRHRRQPAAGGLRRQDARRHRRRGPRRARRPATAPPIDAGASTRTTSTQIPANVTARLLPKTLFGERFVGLRAARQPELATPLADGDVIGQDRSRERHRAAAGHRRPAAAAAGGAAAGPLVHPRRGRRRAARPRRRRSGQNLASAGTYVGQINTVLPQLQADISELADFADTYQSRRRRPARRPGQPVDHQPHDRRPDRAAAPHVHRRAPARRTPRRASWRPTSANLISLAQTSRPVLGVFAKYSPEYPCLLNGLTRFDPMISQAFGADGDPALNLNITVEPAAAQPVPARRPAAVPRRAAGPDCRGLTNIDAIIAAAQHGEYYCPNSPADGVDSTDNPTTGNPHCLGGSGPNDVPPGAGQPERRQRRAPVPPGRLDRRTGLRAQHPRLPDRRRTRKGVRPGRATMAPLLRRDPGELR